MSHQVSGNVDDDDLSLTHVADHMGRKTTPITPVQKPFDPNDNTIVSTKMRRRMKKVQEKLRKSKEDQKKKDPKDGT